MEGVLDQLASPGVSSAVASFRAAILCPCRPGDSVEKVPIRMTAKPVSDSRVNLVALQKLGAVAQEDLDALQSGLVIDVWSTNWITAEVLVSRNGVVLEASHMFEILTGVPVSRVVGMKASHVLGSSCEGVISGRKTQSETRMRHADQSVFSVSLLGPGDVTLGQKRKKVLVVRGVHEAPEADTEVLHRMQVSISLVFGSGITAFPASTVLWHRSCRPSVLVQRSMRHFLSFCAAGHLGSRERSTDLLGESGRSEHGGRELARGRVIEHRAHPRRQGSVGCATPRAVWLSKRHRWHPTGALEDVENQRGCRRGARSGGEW